MNGDRFVLMECSYKEDCGDAGWLVRFQRAYHVLTGSMQITGLVKEEAYQYEFGKLYWMPLPNPQDKT